MSSAFNTDAAFPVLGFRGVASCDTAIVSSKSFLMSATEYSLTTTVDKAVREIKTETAKTEKLNESIGIQVKKAVSTSVNDMKAEMLINVRDTLSKTQEEIRKTEKEMEQLRENIRFESGFRKFLLWLTPALLVVQTIVLAISLL